jgi:hypothetical protein
MFTSPKYETADMIKRHELLGRIAAMVDSRSLRTTLGKNLGTVNAASLKKAHERVETVRTGGKIVLAGSRIHHCVSLDTCDPKPEPICKIMRPNGLISIERVSAQAGN